MNEEITENLLDSVENLNKSKKPKSIIIGVILILIIIIIGFFIIRTIGNLFLNHEIKPNQNKFNIIREYNGNIFASVDPSFSQAIEITDQTKVTNLNLLDAGTEVKEEAESISFAVNNDTLYYYDFYYDGNKMNQLIYSYNPEDQARNLLFKGQVDFSLDFVFHEPIFIGENIFIPYMNYDKKQCFIDKIDINQNQGKGTELTDNEGRSSALTFNLYSDSTLYPKLVETNNKGYYIDQSGEKEFKITEINPDGTQGNEITINSDYKLLKCYAIGDNLFFDTASNLLTGDEHIVKRLDLNAPDNGLQDVYTFIGKNQSLIDIVDNQLYLWDNPIALGSDNKTVATFIQVDLDNQEENEIFKFNLNPAYFEIFDSDRELYVEMTEFMPTDTGYYFELRNREAGNKDEARYALFYVSKETQEAQVLYKRQNIYSD